MVWIVIIAIFWSSDWLICWIVAAPSTFHVESLFCNCRLKLEYLLRQFALFVGQIWGQSGRGVWCCRVINSRDIYSGSICRSEAYRCIQAINLLHVLLCFYVCVCWFYHRSLAFTVCFSFEVALEIHSIFVCNFLLVTHLFCDWTSIDRVGPWLALEIIEVLFEKFAAFRILTCIVREICATGRLILYKHVVFQLSQLGMNIWDITWNFFHSHCFRELWI